MGVLKGTINYRKLFVRGALPEEVHQHFMARIRARGFKPLVPEDEDDASVGWVPVERPFDAEVSFRSEGVFFGSYLNLAVRIDRWKFPPALVKAKLDVAQRALREKTGKERLSRAEKAELREAVEKKLRRDGEPVTTTFDLSWDLDKGILRLFGASKSSFDHFVELFEKTFQLQLVPSGPFVIGVLAGMDKEALEVVEPARI